MQFARDQQFFHQVHYYGRLPIQPAEAGLIPLQHIASSANQPSMQSRPCLMAGQDATVVKF